MIVTDVAEIYVSMGNDPLFATESQPDKVRVLPTMGAVMPVKPVIVTTPIDTLTSAVVPLTGVIAA